MPSSQPVCASGSHELQRPRPIPGKVKEACLLMIYGRADDAEAVPLDFVQSAKLVGIRPNIFRKWLHKPAVVQFIRRERAAFRTAICAANEYALRKVRDTSANGMCVVASVRQLEGIDEVASTRPAAMQQPGITIRLINVVAATNDAPAATNAPAIELKPTVPVDPIFRSR
jgi:hypothetical protein